MARSKMRLVSNPRAIPALRTSAQAVALMTGLARAVADACNSESTWGGYESEVEVDSERVVARVWSIGANDDEARTNRMIRNLGAGR